MTSPAKEPVPDYRRKLIEVDLPLDAINAESAREKSIRHGHPSTLHLWWARRPLASCRAVIFGSMVDDPSSCPDEFPTPESQAVERERLHDIIRRLVKWESTDETKPQNIELLAEARWEIARSLARSRNETPPDRDDRKTVLSYLNDKGLTIYDPFCGGGSIPLEAQRLGLRATGSDLNPVAVLLTKALIDFPHQFQGQPPVNPGADPMGITTGKGKGARQFPWRGAAGLANDIRYYGQWMRERAWERIGHFYPTAKLPDGNEASVIAWLWARTIPCPNPACGVSMPLMRTFQISTKNGNQHWTKPFVDREGKTVSFTVQGNSNGVPDSGTVNRNGATCIACGNSSSLPYVREQARSGAMGHVMTAIVAEGDRKRIFLSPTEEHTRISASAHPAWKPTGHLPARARSISVQIYGFTEWHQLFTERQLLGRTTFIDSLNTEVKDLLLNHGSDEEYANIVCTYLALAVSRDANRRSQFNIWDNAGHKVAGVFGRQGIPMVWDFPECNPFSQSAGNWSAEVDWIAEVLQKCPTETNEGRAYQANATTTIHAENGPVIVTDPPYYDNIHYADSSDFFYIWLRTMLRDIHPNLFASIKVPQEEEMIASKFKFDNPRQTFENRLNQTLQLIRTRCSPEFPSSIFYAYKQQEEEREGRASTGWETMLEALVGAGFQINGTWPMRTEYTGNLKKNVNALASSVVLVCRPRPEDAPTASRREFLNALEAELPTALDHLTREGHIAPVDLAQAAIGPGMQVYSRYSQVETISGDRVTVREALAAINQAIANYDERQEGELDPPTRFCLDWMKQCGFEEGSYGEAETLARAKDVAIEDELRDAHDLVTAQGGSVQLRPPDYFSANRLPSSGRITAWEGCFRMTWNLDHEDGSIQGAADIARRMGSDAESVERLARILYNHFDRTKDSRRAVMFNNLVTSWDDIQVEMSRPPQGRMNLR